MDGKQIVTRQEAIEKGLDKYFTGEPCNKKGHISERYVSSYKCIDCVHISNHSPETKAIQVEYEKTPERISKKKEYKKSLRGVEANEKYNNSSRCKMKKAENSKKPTSKLQKRQYYYSDKGQLVAKRSQLKRHYNLTLEEYNNMLDRQNNCCALCNAGFEDETPFVDHNHETGKIRGLIHRSCNSLLGHAADEILKLQQAIRYLRRYS